MNEQEVYAREVHTMDMDTPITLGQVLEMIQRSAPETVGYSRQSETAFRHGWDVAMNTIYDDLCRVAGVIIEVE